MSVKNPTHETAVLFEEILKIACRPDVLMPTDSLLDIKISASGTLPDGVFHHVKLGPYGSIRITATISLAEDGVRLQDLMRSKYSTVPYSDPELFKKVRSLIKWANPWRNR